MYRKKNFFIEKKFQKFNYFYGFFLYKFSGSSNKASIKIF